MDAGEIFGATLLAIAAIGCMIVISFTLAMNMRKFVNKTFKRPTSNEAPFAVPDSEQSEDGRAVLGNTSEPHAQVARNLSQFAVLRPLHLRFRELVYLSATAPDNIEWLAHRADGAAYPAVRPEIVSETEVAIPTVETSVLDWFAKTVDTILDKMESAKTESRFLTAQRDALLPKLVSGEVRVRDGGT